MLRKVAIISIYILVFLSLPLISETIILKNGKVIKGQVIDHDAESIKIKTDDKVEVYSKSKVYKIVYSNNQAVVKRILEKESSNLARTQKQIENELKTERKAIDNRSSKQKKETDVTIIRLSKKIEKLEQKINRLKVKIKRLQKTIRDSKGKNPSSK
ncbi:MAG: hypothetical protein H7A25_14455 [Leptospiraceae bacterium]|nr:hypothetical protein [Leptospiraceae bacterium]